MQSTLQIPSVASADVARDPAAIIRRASSAFSGRLRFESDGLLTMNQTGVLGMLFRYGDLSPSTIAARMGRSAQTLTRILQRLENDGLIERRDDPADGRRFLLALTLEGREALGNEMRPRDDWLSAALVDQLTEEERDILVVASRLLARLADIPLSPNRRRAPVDDE
jgi:DNA-binding MarR family transcriptional regulator